MAVVAKITLAVALCVVPCGLALAGSAGPPPVVEFGTTMVYLANSTDPGLGTSWTATGFDDGSWQVGGFGVGYEIAGGAENLILTEVPPGTASVYTRTVFTISDVASVHNVLLGADYDDGFVAWINGVEVFRSQEMPPGDPEWNTTAASHESTNGELPSYDPLIDITGAAVAALQDGPNVLAVGVWNSTPASTDQVLVPLLALNVPPSLVRQPYLQQTTSSSVTIRWRTSTPSSSRVLYGTTPGNLTWTVEQLSPTTDHAITLEALASDTPYFYAVGNDFAILAGGDSDHSFTTAPLPTTSKPFRVWVLGDSGTADAGAFAVRDAYHAFAGGAPPDLWLMLGDNAYPSGTDADYQLGLFDVYPDTLRRAALWPVLGNHDGVSSSSPSQSGPYFDMFTLPGGGEAGGVASGTEAYYSFDHGNVHFVALDSHGSDRDPGSPMLTWLEQDLAATAQDWIVAYWHHPPYSKGSHDSDAEAPLIEMRENVVPILEDYGVDLVLSGHSHTYERSVLLDGHYGSSDTLAPDMVVDGGDGRADGDGVYWKPNPGPDPHRGAVYTVAGCSGKIVPAALDHPAMLVSLETLGSVVLDVEGDRLDVTFVDGTAQIRDYFTVVKGCPDSAHAFSSLNTETSGESFLFTPGLCEAGPPCASDIGSSVSSNLLGSFWRLGDGDPADGAGTDSGSYRPLQSGDSGWVRTGGTGPAHVQGAWSTSEGVDGCLDLTAPEPDCMAMVLADQVAGESYFAALTAPAEPSGDYFFDQPQGEPIDLAAIPLANITGSSTVNSYTRTVDFLVSSPDAGLYADPVACGDDLLVGYRLYQKITGRIDPPPVNRALASGWEVAVGGQLPSGEPIPLDSPATVTLTCYTAINAYVGAVLVFESGFELPMVSQTPWYVLCSNCAQDDDQDGSCAESILGEPGPECDDADDTVFPGAPQICDDGLNNDCGHWSWPALWGTNESDDDGDGITECLGDCDDSDPDRWGIPGEAQLLQLGADKQTLLWNAPALPGASSVDYDVLRATQASGFAGAVCVATDSHATEAEDPTVPPAGTAFYYLVRAENGCDSGSLGTDSDGVPRPGSSCP